MLSGLLGIGTPANALKPEYPRCVQKEPLMKPLIFASAIAGALALSAPAHAAARDLEGTWQNDRGGGALSVLAITYEGSTYSVGASAPCGRKACDLGDATGYVLTAPGGRNPDRDAVGVSAGFESGGASIQVIATGGRGGRLQVTVIQAFRDGRPAIYTNENFSRRR